MIRPAVTFGQALAGPANAGLRERVAALAAEAPGAPLQVDTVLALHARLERGEAGPGVPARWLLLDPHRWVFYEEGPDAPGVGSVARFLVDAYPVQPPGLLRDRPYRFLYAPETLDVLPLFWSGSPGVIIVGDLVTGEILESPALPHPAERGPGTPDAGTGARDPLVLGDTWTDAGFRSGAAPVLDGLLSAAGGIVRERTDTTDHASLPYSLARLSLREGAVSEWCGGKAATPAEAAVVATCEVLERFQATFPAPGETLVRGSYVALRGRALDPRALFFDGVPAQGRALRPYAEDAATLWTAAADPLGGPSLLVPAEEVWFGVAAEAGRFISQTTSGCAAGATVEEAAIFATLEAVERDAFLTAWYLRRPCARIDTASVRSEPFQLLLRRWKAAYAGYDLFLFDATTDVRVPAVVGVAARREGDGPRAFVSAAARISSERACYTALKDLTGFNPVLAEEKRRAYRASLDAPRRIDGPQGHFETYALDESFARLQFLDFGAEPRRVVAAAEIDARSLVRPEARLQPGAVVRRVAAHLRALGAGLYLKDLTHPTLAARGLHCVRAITPGLYPMWFGPETRRFRVTKRLRRLALEWKGERVGGAADCNLEVHPLA